MNVWHSLAIIGVSALVTFFLRATPFMAGKWLREQPLVRDLSLLLPIGVMTVLVLYSVRDISWAGWAWVPPVLGIAVTAGLHLWRWNVLLSLVGGIAAYALALWVLG
ncbi:branched-chain amino acid ABC transporter [Gulosibacter macacae]|uniref:Branched-chain amino acid ABC transporter n=1 Tax=Gulosibacter macacae TaxID=2488791 RepID=A0A3P3VVX8_9MICO|nr:AzlD domain-containing protein [Gulosibacter macacae]RRJ86962.1 branched-chain amino acid ABC transporter [Gulosibacter macacae]